MLHNPSQSASFSCMIIILRSTPKNLFRFNSTTGSSQRTLLSCISVLFIALSASTSPQLFDALLFCVKPFSDITVPAYLSLPGYSTLDKLMHSNRAALCCCSEKVLLKKFTFSSSKLSQICLYLERNQIVPISVLKPSYSSSHRYYLQPILVLTRKTFIFTEQNLVIQIQKEETQESKCSLKNLVNFSIQKHRQEYTATQEF